ncbi:right-handed parallel beta-helix repeat-containing protein [Halomarina oriensis]|uniref:Right handed beta helix domain-containing protein n=1 Tax=Halomarina oriensis TaxID=671145 RepID=A0A6B0GX31_9EURY|nr:right-handed parallel beta-helix repeat-containing protein [Halomarina oriensis]MWG36318.1 hypothetical protein [Halomarina oriensis]
MTTYYVSTDGSDGNSGSKSDPFATVDEAVGRVGAGDTISLRGGVHRPSGTVKLYGANGSAGDRITLTGHPGERAVVDFGGQSGGGWNSYDDGAIRVGSSYWTIKDLAVQNSPYGGIVLENSGAHHNRLENVDVSYCFLPGILGLEGANDNVVVDSASHDNFNPDGTGGDSDGVQFAGTRNNVVRNTVSYNNADDGFDLWESVGCRIEGCVAYDNGKRGGDGNGYKLGGGESGDNTVLRSVAYENTAVGFNNNEANRQVRVYNCTSYNNGDVGYAAWDGGSGTTHVYRNCISYDDGGQADTDGSDTTEANTWDLDIGNPEFVSTDRGADDFLRLTADSPCVGAGVAVGPVDSDGSPDLGAYPFDGEESGGSSGSTVRYHDGDDWREGTLRYHDGSGFRQVDVRQL